MKATTSLLWKIVNLHRLDASLRQFRLTKEAYDNPDPNDNPDGERRVDPLLFVYKKYGLEYRQILRSQLQNLQEAILLSRETLDESLFLKAMHQLSETKLAQGAAAEDTNKEGKDGIMCRWLERLDSIESNRTKFPLKFFEDKLN